MCAQKGRGQGAFERNSEREEVNQRERKRESEDGDACANTLCLRKEGIRKKITKSMSNLYPRRKIKDVSGKQEDKFKLQLNLLNDQQLFNCKDRLCTPVKQKDGLVVTSLLFLGSCMQPV